jgi:hypothetical protein
MGITFARFGRPLEGFLEELIASLALACNKGPRSFHRHSQTMGVLRYLNFDASIALRCKLIKI